MKNPVLLLLLLLPTFIPLAIAQTIAPFQSDDIAAQAITPEVVLQLTNKKWYLHTRKFLLKGKVSTMNWYDDAGAYEFTYGGDCQQPGFPGSWTINDAENLLIITADYVEDAKKQNHILLGGYAIYRITDKELILGKVLTSSFDNKIFFCFEDQERHQQRSMTADAYRRDYITQRIPDIEENQTDGATKKQLLKADLFMRGLKEEPGYAYFMDETGKVYKVKAE